MNFYESNTKAMTILAKAGVIYTTSWKEELGCWSAVLYDKAGPALRMEIFVFPDEDKSGVSRDRAPFLTEALRDLPEWVDAVRASFEVWFKHRAMQYPGLNYRALRDVWWELGDNSRQLYTMLGRDNQLMAEFAVTIEQADVLVE